MPPAEIIDRVLAESAYAVEIGGPGFAQARENLKKIRGLIRRIQNRGYTTLGPALRLLRRNSPPAVTNPTRLSTRPTR